VKLHDDSKPITFKNVNDIVFVRDKRIVALGLECDSGSQYETKEIGCKGGPVKLCSASQLCIWLFSIVYQPLAALHKALLRSGQAKDSNTKQDGIVLFGMNPKIDGGGFIRYIPYNPIDREFFASIDANATQRDRVHQRPIGEISNHLRIFLVAFC
jgi:hypothetical protein